MDGGPSPQVPPPQAPPPSAEQQTVEDPMHIERPKRPVSRKSPSKKAGRGKCESKRRKITAVPPRRTEPPTDVVSEPTSTETSTAPVTSLTDASTCIICHSIARPPSVSCSTGCLMCGSCASAYVASHGGAEDSLQCPYCRQRLLPLHEQCFLDRQLRDRPAECGNGCGAKGLTVGTVERHETLCAKRARQCRYAEFGCWWLGMEIDEAAHTATCPYAVVATCHAIQTRVAAEAEARLADIEARLDAAASIGGLVHAVYCDPDCERAGAPLVPATLGVWTAHPVAQSAAFVVVVEALRAGGRGCALRMEDPHAVRVAYTIAFRDPCNECVAVASGVHDFSPDAAVYRLTVHGSPSVAEGSRVDLYAMFD